MDKTSRNIFIEGGKRMKISFKANVDVEFEVKTKKKSRKNKKNKSWFLKILKWFFSLLAEFLLTEYILKELVALIINIIENWPFYFYSRMFYFEVKYE
jgi:hypothetical protein